ncbi:MAG TPA: transaldolase family protein, partial [Candidatus Babeliales bacterium]|nr:transaldolase family protein [Candidatus Babeliales bacterium]
ILPEGSISVEVTETEPDLVLIQARKLASLCDGIVIKVPCHAKYYNIIRKLIAEGIPLNITLVFSLSQGLMMAKLGAQYISPFIGRLDDIAVSSGALCEGRRGNGIELIQHLRHIIDWYNFETELLAASIRDVAHFEKAMLAGADIATVPVDVFEKSLAHQLTDKGMAQFLADWQKLNITRFP